MKKDEFGPEYVIEVYDPKIGMTGFLVIDNTKLGPGKGGMRMSPTVTADEVFRLARVMTWKTALAGIPFGGAKSGIIWKGGSDKLKKQFIQSFARAIKLFTPNKYIGAPDVSVGEQEIQWFIEATGNKQTATGKPTRMGGIPHEFGSTGLGVAHAADVAAQIIGLEKKHVRIAIEGFGNVGSFAFKFLKQFGYRIVALADSRGASFHEAGFDEKILIKTKAQTKTVADYPSAKKLTRAEFFDLPIDILITAGVTDVIHENNKHAIKAKLIVEGSNIPMGERIEEEFFQKGVVIVPDFVANSGGLISSYAEYKNMESEQIFELIKKIVRKTTRTVISKSIKDHQNPRDVALAIAKRKIV